jgi:hypothetical protein
MSDNSKDKDMAKLTDESWMTFGKYGPDGIDPRKMKDVPCDYWMYLFNQNEGKHEDCNDSCKVCDVLDYINDDLESIEKIARMNSGNQKRMD